MDTRQVYGPDKAAVDCASKSISTGAKPDIIADIYHCSRLQTGDPSI
jgi:hypothetical protein